MKELSALLSVLIALFLHVSSAGQDYVHTVDWSYDGQYYAVARGKDVHIYEFESEQFIEHVSLDDNIETIDWSPSITRLRSHCLTAILLFVP